MTRYLSAVLLSLLCGFVLCVAIPQTTYLQNVNEFAFEHVALLKAMAFPFACVVLAALALQLLLAQFFPNGESVWLGRTWRISPSQIFILAVLALLLIEGMIISYRLPALDGTGGIYSSVKRTAASVASWGIGLFLAVWCWRWFARRFFLICGIVFIMFAAILGDAAMGMTEKMQVTDTVDNVLSNLAFHPKDNVIIIVADALPTFAVEEVLTKRIDIKRKLKDFTVFRNNLGSGRSTFWAIPSMLRGDIFTGGDLQFYLDGVFNSSQSFVNRFARSGYDIYLSSTGIPLYNGIYDSKHVSIKGISEVPVYVDALLYTQLFFRFIPYFLKKYYIESYTKIESYVHQYTDCKQMNIDPLYEKMISAIDNVSQRPTAHFHHYLGAHQPFTRAPDGKKLPQELHASEAGLVATVEYILNNFVLFIDHLIHAGIYDSTTIALIADHGDPNGFRRYGSTGSFKTPLFMIKPPKANYHELNISYMPMSSLYLPEIIEQTHNGFSLNIMSHSLPSTRMIFANNDNLILHAHGNDLEAITYTQAESQEIKMDALAVNGKIIPGKYYPIRLIGGAIPSHLRYANFSHGWGLALAENEINEFGWMVQTNRDTVAAKIRLCVVYEGEVSSPSVSVAINDLNDGSVVFENKLLSDAIESDMKNILYFDVYIPSLLVNEGKEIKLSIKYLDDVNIFAVIGLTIVE